MADAIVVAAPASGSGKTLITLALLRALKNAGINVASAKIGPDYIDPRFHEAATGRPCINLDPWAMRSALVENLVFETSRATDLTIIEGVMGLFDGTDEGLGSTADLAQQLKLPVVLVVDASRQSQSIAALVHGFVTYRPELNVAGVILNCVANERHQRALTKALPHELVLGSMPRLPGLQLPSRHLGLVQASELAKLEEFIDQAAELAANSIDLHRLKALAQKLPEPRHPVELLRPLGQVIAVANDSAFGFSYQHVLTGWAKQGAELRFFSPLADQPPYRNADAVFLPGGYPELFAGELAANSNFLDGLLQFASRGGLIYGECGGFMVLGRAIIDAAGTSHAMSALLPHATTFATRKLSIGYRQLRHKSPLPFPRELRGHEFHYSTLAEPLSGDPLFAMRNSSGGDMGTVGLRIGRIMGSYAHVIDGMAS